jgi:hypothetical protein
MTLTLEKHEQLFLQYDEYCNHSFVNDGEYCNHDFVNYVCVVGKKQNVP